MVQHEQQGALHIDIPGTLHLEAVSLLGRGHPVPLQGTTGTLLMPSHGSHLPAGSVAAELGWGSGQALAQSHSLGQLVIPAQSFPCPSHPWDVLQHWEGLGQFQP